MARTLPPPLASTDGRRWDSRGLHYRKLHVHQTTDSGFALHSLLTDDTTVSVESFDSFADLLKSVEGTYGEPTAGALLHSLTAPQGQEGSS